MSSASTAVPLNSRVAPASTAASEGALLVATGERHRREACEAAGRIRPHLGGRPLWLVTDRPDAVTDGLFDAVLPHPDPHHSYRDKIPPLLALPFRHTLFLDTDLELLAPLEDVFALLRRMHLVGCHAPVRWCQWRDPAVPEGFCELNSGVLGLRRCPRVRRLIRRWLATYDQAGVSFDQASLRSALWQSCSTGLRVWVLPPEYNLRTTKPWIAGKGMAVKVVHGRIPEEMRAPLASYLNRNVAGFRASSAFPTRQNASVLPVSPAPVASVPPASTGGLPASACRRVFVLGAGRSGTSLLAGLFRRSGLFMGEAAYLRRDANPHGFFEDREVNAINEALLAALLPPPPVDHPDGFAEGTDVPGPGQRWLARLPLVAQLEATPELQQRIRGLYAKGPSCFKDPRFSYTLGVWRQLLADEDQEHSAFLCVFRDPAVVLASVLEEVHTAAYLRGLAISVDQVLSCWRLQYRHVLERHAASGRWLFVAYDQLLEPSGLDRLEAFTGHHLDRSLPEPNLNRSRPRRAVPTAVAEIYDALCRRAGFSPQG